MFQPVEVFKETQEDWFSSYEIKGWYDGRKNNMLVTVSFNSNELMRYGPLLYQTQVWGNDDLGMCFEHEDETAAWNMFVKVIGMKYVNRADLKKLGFKSA